jgi:hypothetical protein
MKRQLSLNQLRKELVRVSVITMGENVFRHCAKKHVVYERSTVQYLLKTRLNYSYETIGYLTSCTEPFDHSTVLTACRKVKNEIALYDDRKRNLAKWNKILDEIQEIEYSDKGYQWLVLQREKATGEEIEIINDILTNLGYGKQNKK